MARNTGPGPYQSATTGRFVTKKYAQSHPDKTVGHRPSSPKPPAGRKKSK